MGRRKGERLSARKALNLVGIGLVLVLTITPLGLVLFPGSIPSSASLTTRTGYPVTIPIREIRQMTGPEAEESPAAVPALLPIDALEAEHISSNSVRSSISDAMREAFRPVLDSSGRESLPPTPTASAGRYEVLQLNFDLDEVANSREPITVTKSVYRQGRFAGRIDIQINEAGDILVHTSDLSSLLTDLPVSATRTARSLTLSELRDVGLDLRYEPIEDRLVLN